ncbi:MAG: hypothetical protein P1U53_06405 [Sulfitobacter sp.]|nr:hypothetical protein [Sulfitobacter sp.]
MTYSIFLTAFAVEVYGSLESLLASDRDKVVDDMRRQLGNELPVLEALQRDDLVRHGRIDFLMGALGFQRGMLKSWDGRILALIVVPATVFGHLSFWAPRIETTLNHFEPYLEVVQKFGVALDDQLVSFGQLPDADRKLDKNLGSTIAALASNTAYFPRLSYNTEPQELLLWQVTQPNFKPTAVPTVGGNGNERAIFDAGIAEILPSRVVPSGFSTSVASNTPLAAIDQAVFALRNQFENVRRFDSTRTLMIQRGIPLRRLAIHKVKYTGRVQMLGKAELSNFTAQSGNAHGLGAMWHRASDHPILAHKARIDPNSYNFIINCDHAELRAETLSTQFFKVKVA